MSYTITQKLENILVNENLWEDQITSDNALNYFIAVTSNQIAEGATQREVTVQMFLLENAPENNETNTGAYVRQEGETSVKAVLIDLEGKEVASNVTNYPD